jgi:hypothetical protein
MQVGAMGNSRTEPSESPATPGESISRRACMGEKNKQPKEPKKKPVKTLIEKRKEKREKAAHKTEE